VAATAAETVVIKKDINIIAYNHTALDFSGAFFYFYPFVPHHRCSFMSSPVFIQKLLNRLKSGDSRSIHLNALPGNFARLDVYELSKIDQSLHLKLLEKLLTQPTFELRITIPPDVIAQKNAEEQKQLRKTIQRLNHLNYQEKEEMAEHHPQQHLDYPQRGRPPTAVQ
jgi:hypothetical protein